MKTKKWLLSLWMICAILCFSACEDWGKEDPPAGNQKKPDTTVELLSTYSFTNSFDELDATVVTYTGGESPIIDYDGDKGMILHPREGYLKFNNPLTGVQADMGASVTMWVKVPADGRERALFSFIDEAGSTVYFNGNGTLSYSGTAGSLEYANSGSALTSAFTSDEWHFIGVAIGHSGYKIFVDGEEIISETIETDTEGRSDISDMVDILLQNSEFYLAHGTTLNNTADIYIGDVNIYKNIIAERHATPSEEVAGLPNPVYFLSFEDGLNGAQIVGAGSLTAVEDEGFGSVFRNATGGMRQNYLLLPDNVLSHSGTTYEMTIGFWVNSLYAGESGDYMWAPLFMAYGAAPENGENTMPMLALQYRGIGQINNNGWTDLTDAENVAGANTLYHEGLDWLADKQWHYYTATFTESRVIIYFDGEVANEWTLSGDAAGGSFSGLFTNGADLKYICLGGNQAWNWGDNDPGFMFDDFVVYNRALSQDQIQTITKEKKPTFPEPVYSLTFEDGLNGAQIVGAGSLTTVEDEGFGSVFRNATGGMRQNYLLLPDNVLSHSGTTYEMTIGFWVNSLYAGESGDYMWAPLFMAYGAAPENGENTTPMLALQYRGIGQINNNGWTDLTDAENVAGANTLYHEGLDWLADKQWHYYTATFTESRVIIYFDGEVANEWTLSGDAAGGSFSGLFTNGADLKYICLGGNQAWNWGDNDPGFMFDDLEIYDVVLTQSQIKTIIERK